MNQQFVDKLKQNNIPVTAHIYQGGYHYWDYWQREFHSSWPVLAGALGGPTPTVPAAQPVL